MISFSCISCQKKLAVKDELAGKKVKCPGCGNAVVVPQAAAAPLSSQAGSDSSHVEKDKTVPSQTSAASEERTLPPKNRDQAGQDSLGNSSEQTGLRDGRREEVTQCADGPSPE